MNTILKRSLHLGAVLALGMLIFAGGHASAVNGIPVSACTTLASFTNYFLTQNINAAGTCFIVSEGTSLDLNKHTIKGNNTGDGITDNGDDAQNVVIVNGTITRFNNGINMSNSDSFNMSLDSINASLNTGDGIASEACCNTVSNVQANNNGDDGIDFTDDACCNTFTNVNTSSNAETGLFAEDCCSLASGVTSNNNDDGQGIELLDCCSTAQYSTANGNDGAGIDMDSDDNKVESSTANNNAGEGIFFGDGCCSMVDHATANGNGGTGISAENVENQVTNSTANKNGGDGIDLSDDPSNVVLRSTTSGNQFFGVVIECNSNVVGLIAHSNKCEDLCEFGGNCTNVSDFADHIGCGC